MSYQYDDYLDRHKRAVADAYNWLAKNLSDMRDLKFEPGISYNICFQHDASKSEPDEYAAYDAYFYGNNRSYQVVEDYNRAWLMHIHRNPHHWQHWVLVNDDPKEGTICLEMPMEYIIEMICDWWSFSWIQGDLREIFNWWDQHKDYILLEEFTRRKVMDILNAIDKKLNELDQPGNDMLAHHGVKGQKWGVQNGPPYPLDKSKKHDTIVADAIESGLVSKKINPEKQKRHTLSGHTPGRSYLNGDMDYAQKLVDELSGTGQPLVNVKTGAWLRKEKVVSTDIVGVHVDRDGNETTTNKAMISYSKTGTHIYPRKEIDNEN